MDTERKLEARRNENGEIEAFGCSCCLWTVAYSRVNMIESRFRPQEIAMMFFNVHECEAHQAPAEPSPAKADAKDAA